MMSEIKKMADYLSPDELNTLEQIQARVKENNSVVLAMKDGYILVNIKDLNDQIDSDRKELAKLKAKAIYRRKAESVILDSIRGLSNSQINSLKSKIEIAKQNE